VVWAVTSSAAKRGTSASVICSTWASVWRVSASGFSARASAMASSASRTALSPIAWMWTSMPARSMATTNGFSTLGSSRTAPDELGTSVYGSK
jgi:hypothetical protein